MQKGLANWTLILDRTDFMLTHMIRSYGSCVAAGIGKQQNFISAGLMQGYLIKTSAGSR
jgi:hypothetical protein